MALVHTQKNYVSTVNERHINNVKAQYGVIESNKQKWMFLIANNIKFANKCDGAVRVSRPDDEMLYQWIERIAIGGQCSLLFVEALSLDDVRMRRIKLICEISGVTLVNLTLDTQLPENLVLGPWQ